VSVVAHGDVLTLVRRQGLWGRGIGWIDAHLMASALLDRVRLWTLDRRLALSPVRLMGSGDGGLSIAQRYSHKGRVQVDRDADVSGVVRPAAFDPTTCWFVG
jgi:hypothetical protein